MDSQSTSENVQDKILNTAIDLIESGDDDSPTVRKIAEVAGVNVGAVNYYFGSKDALMDAASKRVLHRIHDCVPILDDMSLEPLERLKLFMISFIPRMLVCKAPIFHRIFSNWASSRYEPHFKVKHELAVYMKETILDKINETVMEITGDTDESLARMLSLQLLCAAVIPNLPFMRARLLDGMELPPIEEQISALLTRMFQ